MQVPKIIVCFLFTICAAACFSQTKSDSIRYVKFAATGIVNKTKEASSYVLYHGISYNINREKVSLNTAANWIYGTQQNVLTNNDLSAYADVNLLKKVHALYYWGLVTYDKSYS